MLCLSLSVVFSCNCLIEVLVMHNLLLIHCDCFLSAINAKCFSDFVVRSNHLLVQIGFFVIYDCIV